MGRPPKFRPIGPLAEQRDLPPVAAPPKFVQHSELPLKPDQRPPIPEDAEPIETAPKNGSTVWLYNEQITHGVRGLWRMTRHCVNSGGGFRWVVNCQWVDPMTKKPLGAEWTHWRLA